jgi:translation initiation factor IF-2
MPHPLGCPATPQTSQGAPGPAGAARMPGESPCPAGRMRGEALGTRVFGPARPDPADCVSCGRHGLARGSWPSGSRRISVTTPKIGQRPRPGEPDRNPAAARNRASPAPAPPSNSAYTGHNDSRAGPQLRPVNGVNGPLRAKEWQRWDLPALGGRARNPGRRGSRPNPRRGPAARPSPRHDPRQGTARPNPGRGPAARPQPRGTARPNPGRGRAARPHAGARPGRTRGGAGRRDPNPGARPGPTRGRPGPRDPTPEHGPAQPRRRPRPNPGRRPAPLSQVVRAGLPPMRAFARLSRSGNSCEPHS